MLGFFLAPQLVVATGSWVTLAPGSWELSCQAPGYWPYHKTLLVQGREHLSCLMVPVARLVGTLQPPAGTCPQWCWCRRAREPTCPGLWSSSRR